MKKVIVLICLLLPLPALLSAQGSKSYIDYKKGIKDIDTIPRDEAIEILLKFAPGIDTRIVPGAIAYSPSINDGKTFYVIIQNGESVTYHGFLIKFDDVLNIVYKKKNFEPFRRSIFIITKNKRCYRWNYWVACTTGAQIGDYDQSAPSYSEGTCADNEHIHKVLAALVTMCPNLTVEKKYKKLGTNLYDIIE
jgi:hypothetical protein